MQVNIFSLIVLKVRYDGFLLRRNHVTLHNSVMFYKYRCDCMPSSPRLKKKKRKNCNPGFSSPFLLLLKSLLLLLRSLQIVTGHVSKQEVWQVSKGENCNIEQYITQK